MKVLRQISISLAGAILLLHSILPHKHHTELNALEHVTQHESATSLLDFIKLAFHLDQGEDHLENFKVAEQYQLSIDLFVFSQLDFSLEAKVVELWSIDFPVYQYTQYHKYLLPQLRFRGPPSVA